MVDRTWPKAEAVEAKWWRSRRAWGEVALILVLTVALIAVLVTACRGEDGQTTDLPATTTSDPHAAAEAEVRQAYRDFLKMVTRLSAQPDPADPAIAELTTGDVRANLEQSLAEDQAQGVVIRDGPYDEQTILTTSVSGDAATLTVCYVGHSGVYDAVTDEEIVAPEVVTTLDHVEMVREAGAWKVRFVDNEEGDQWAGVHDCEQ